MSPKQDILDAIANSNYDTLQVVLDNIPKETLPNLLSKVNYQDEDTSPIHWAVKKQCHNDLVILMRGKGAKMSCYQSDSRKGSRLTPLHQAVLEDSPRHLTLLLKLGADPQLEGVCDVMSGTAKDFAVHLERKTLLKIFASYEKSRSEDPRLGLMMVLIFVVCPIASFLFFTALKRWRILD